MLIAFTEKLINIYRLQYILITIEVDSIDSLFSEKKNTTINKRRVLLGYPFSINLTIPTQLDFS